MGTSGAIAVIAPRSRIRMWLGVVLVGAGYLGHFLAARAIGGSYVAYRDHTIGFVGFALGGVELPKPLAGVLQLRGRRVCQFAQHFVTRE